MAKRRSSTSGWCRPSPEIERRSPPTGAHVHLCRPQGLHDVGPAKSPWRFSTRSGRSCLGFMQGSVVLWVWLVSDVVRDDMEPARASGIMWFSTPHRCDGHPCLPSYHPRCGHGRRAPVPQPRPLRPPWRPSGSASGWASLYGFPAAMLKLGLTQRPASRHRWPSLEPAGCSSPRKRNACLADVARSCVPEQPGDRDGPRPRGARSGYSDAGW
jgi:hypothetical protein